ncbi:MAG TPA: glycosyltransferase family 4 protein [Anaerolineales bacterium]|nr:glycosyltransferase family 4 protein [Anaerolineales bacterium]
MKSLMQGVAKNILKAASWNWKPYSRLILYGDNAGWVLDWEMRELKGICERLGVRLAKPLWKHARHPQSIFFSNQFFLQNDDWMNLLPHRIGLAYFHGLPNTGDEDFDNVYRALQKHHQKLARVQVSHTEMRDVVLESGIDPSKVFLIPIGINLDFFPFRTPAMKTEARAELGIPQTAFVVGSFQKDGVGWGEGLEPKRIKGPDVFVETMKRLKKDVPELFVLLSGPARGFVKRGLEEGQIPYRHVYVRSYPEIAKLFQALDLYVVASRQEGGPKAVLESMASGVPLVTTRVGQAMDLVKHGENAWMVDVEDVEALASYAVQIARASEDTLMPVLNAARATAEANCYEAQTPLWAAFMKGFVECARC